MDVSLTSMPWHLQTTDKPNLETSLSNMGPVGSAAAEHYKKLTTVLWKEEKKHDLRPMLFQSQNPHLGLGEMCFASNTKTICLKVQYLIHRCFLQFKVPEMTQAQITSTVFSSIDISVVCIVHPVAQREGLRLTTQGAGRWAACRCRNAPISYLLPVGRHLW